MLQVACPGCGEKFAIHPAMAGKQVQCPGCKAAVVPGGGTRSVSSDDYTGKVELGARMMKGKSGGEGGPARRQLLLVLAAVGVLIVILALYFLVLSD